MSAVRSMYAQLNEEKLDEWQLHEEWLDKCQLYVRFKQEKFDEG
jgi:hypothetical protein